MPCYISVYQQEENPLESGMSHSSHHSSQEPSSSDPHQSAMPPTLGFIPQQPEGRSPGEGHIDSEHSLRRSYNHFYLQGQHSVVSTSECFSIPGESLPKTIINLRLGF